MLLICVMAFLGTILPVLWSNTRATHCVFMWTIWKWSHCPTKRFLLSQGMSISRPVSGRSAFRQWPRLEKCHEEKQKYALSWKKQTQLPRVEICLVTTKSLKYALSLRKADLGETCLLRSAPCTVHTHINTYTHILALLLVVCYVGPWLLCGAMRHLARWCVTCASARLVLVPVLGCPGSRSE